MGSETLTKTIWKHFWTLFGIYKVTFIYMIVDRKIVQNNLYIYRTIVFTKYEDIKKVFDLEEASGRPSSAPGNKTRPGWHTVAKFDPENVDRPPGVLFCQVSLHKIPLV